MVTHPIANHDLSCLTAGILRELVFPSWYCRSYNLHTVQKSGQRKKGKRPCPIKNHNIKNTHLFNILSSGLLFKDQRGEEIKIPNQKIVSLFAICIQIQIQSNKFIKPHCLQQCIKKYFKINPQ